MRCIFVDVSEAGSGGVCGVGDCARLLYILGDSRETCGPRIDSIPPAWPPWRGIVTDSSAPRIQKITLFARQESSHRSLWTSIEPNRTIVRQLRAAFIIYSNPAPKIAARINSAIKALRSAHIREQDHSPRRGSVLTLYRCRSIESAAQRVA